MLSGLISRLSKRKIQGLQLSSPEPSPTSVEQAIPAAGGAGEASDAGVSFAVDDVEPARQSVWTEALIESLNHRFRRKVFAVPEPRRPVINSAMDRVLKHAKPDSDFAARLHKNPPDSGLHPLIDAVHTAFAEHRPLILSPDCIWLAIAQGFSHHVTENAETLRGRLVRHQGKHTLVANVSELDQAAFERAINDLSVQIRDATDPVLHETLVCDFSTTTSAIRAASEVVLMDTFSSYFKYAMTCVCGIPRITLAGSSEDWQRIRDRVEVLDTYELGWWVSKLRPMLDEFIAASEGRPDPEFWKSIYKPKKAYATEAATGWITDLFPYLGDAPGRRRNPALAEERNEWALPEDAGINLTQFPCGLSSVPIELRLPDGSETNADLVAGFFAVEQHSDLSLKPMISWSVTEPPPKAPVVLVR